MTEALVSYAEELAKGGAGHGLVGERSEDAWFEGVWFGDLVVLVGQVADNAEMHSGGISQLDFEWLRARMGAVLDVELEAVLAVEEVEVAVGPSVEVAGPAQCLAGLG